jgi:hypothetical protein
MGGERCNFKILGDIIQYLYRVQCSAVLCCAVLHTSNLGPARRVEGTSIRNLVLHRYCEREHRPRRTKNRTDHTDATFGRIN